MRVADVYQTLNDLAPFADAAEWDNVGLLVGDIESEVQKIYVALDATDHCIERALKQGANLLVTHHPMIFTPLKRVCEGDMIGRRILKMAKNNMSYIALHTNFDIHVMGKIVADKLSLQNQVPLSEESRFGVFGITDEMSLEQYGVFVKDTFALPHVNIFGDPNRPIRRVAICPGSGKSEIPAALASGADVLLTGDIDHHSGIDALANDLCVMDCGHYGLEHVFISYMQVFLHTHYPDTPIMGEDIRFPMKTL